MPRLVTAPDGATWVVTLAGRHSQYAKDEVILAFSRDGETRYARFSPRGAKVPERAYEEASDRLLARLFATAHGAATAPSAGWTAAD